MAPIQRPDIIDIEASGFGPESYPIEIGVALSTGEKYCSLILPAPEWTHWDEAAEKVHRVPRDLLETYGTPMEDVANTLNGLLENKTIYSDGWVVDKPWVDHLFYTAKIPQRFTISSLEMILSEPQMEIWHETKDKVATELHLKRHRASYDVMVIQETFVTTFNKTQDASM